MNGRLLDCWTSSAPTSLKAAFVASSFSSLQTAPFPTSLDSLAQPDFRVLSLDTFRGELPLQFWRICGHFTVTEGKARWHYRVLGAPHLLSESNAQHLKALCHRAQAEPEIAEHVELLFLWEQGLNRLPSNIGALTALRRIELWNNPLPGIPASISQCTALEELVLGEDQRYLETPRKNAAGPSYLDHRLKLLNQAQHRARKAEALRIRGVVQIIATKLQQLGCCSALGSCR